MNHYGVFKIEVNTVCLSVEVSESGFAAQVNFLSNPSSRVHPNRSTKYSVLNHTLEDLKLCM